MGWTLVGCEHKPDIDNYRFLLGEWEISDEDLNKTSYEIWQIVSDTLFEGRMFDVVDGDTIKREKLWLESRDGKIIYSAIVYGYNDDRRIYFDNTLKTIDRTRFENNNHDFPTMIQYKKTGMHFLEILVCDEDDTLPRIRMHKIQSK